VAELVAARRSLLTITSRTLAQRPRAITRAAARVATRVESITTAASVPRTSSAVTTLELAFVVIAPMATT